MKWINGWVWIWVRVHIVERKSHFATYLTTKKISFSFIYFTRDIDFFFLSIYSLKTLSFATISVAAAAESHFLSYLVLKWLQLHYSLCARCTRLAYNLVKSSYCNEICICFINCNGVSHIYLYIDYSMYLYMYKLCVLLLWFSMVAHSMHVINIRSFSFLRFCQ